MARVVQPALSVAAGTYTNSVSVSLSTSTAGATIRYTTNNTQVSASSPVYSGPVVLSQTATLRAVAYKSGMLDSFENAAVYTIHYQVSTSAGSGGSFSPSSRTVSNGGTTTFTVTPAVGYSIQSVTGCGGTLSGSTYTTGVISAACAVSASFSLNSYAVSTSAGAGGSISPTSKAVNHGSSTSFTVTPNTGYSIGAVSGCGGTLSGSTYTTGVITGACTVSGSFSLNSYAVSASAGAGGSISPTSKVVTHGSTTSFTVTPSTGYHISAVSGCGGTLSGTTYTTGGITGACAVSASFSLNSYTISALAGQGGTISPTTVQVSHAEDATFTITPEEGYMIDSVSGCEGQRNGNEFRVANVVSNCDVLASFKEPPSMEHGWYNTDKIEVQEQSISAPAYTKMSTKEIGAVAAETGVRGGQASFVIPVQIAPGRAGMQPDVSLNYNSGRGNGIAGMGWSLSATSSISRCGSSFANDAVTRSVMLSDSDKLCYNGRRLVLISGNYGKNGAVYAPELDDFSRISQRGGDLSGAATYFAVKDSAGRTLLFGDSSTSQVVPDKQSMVQEWLLSKVTDVTGNNTMRYVYQNFGQAEVLLSQIIYTGTSSEDGLGNVRFGYEDRADPSLSYLAGGAIQQTQRLSTMTTFYNNNKIREYRLTYGELSIGSGRTLLRSVTECAFIGNVLVNCLEPTEFDWSEQHAGYSLEWVPFSGYSNYRTITEALPRGDINGDGSRDWNGSFVDAEGTVQATHSFVLPGCGFDVYQQAYVCHQADLDLDGRTDAVKDNGAFLDVGLTSGEGSSITTSWITTSISMNQSSSHQLGRDRVEGFADFNGDGWPDLVMYRVNGAKPDYRVYLHSRNLSAPYSGGGTVIYTAVLEYSGGIPYATTSIQLTGDMNGDGLADVVVMNNKNKFYSYPQPQPERVLYSQWSSSILTFNSMSLPFSASPMQWDYFSYFIDVNNDGLTDWLGWSAGHGLAYSLNTGAGFTPLRSASGDTSWLHSRSYHAINAVHNTEEQTISYPKYSGAFRVMDVNNDGKAELLVPAERLIESCIMYGDVVAGKAVTKEFCGDAMYGAVPQSSNSTATFPIPAESNDESIYRYDSVQFAVSPDGTLHLTRQPTQLIGSATQSAAVDAYGNGLDHLMFTYGTRFTSGQRFNGSTSPLGTQYGTWINRNLGDSTTGQTSMDSLVTVRDGLGKVARWSYLPLATGQNTVADKPLYATSHSYVADNQHFHFASSMYVVSEFSQSNGIGGERKKRFAYRGAVYNHAGKGFSGFRSVIEEDVDLGVIEHADYLQKAPFTGQLQAKFHFKTAEYPAGSFAAVQGWTSPFVYSSSDQNAFDVTGADNAFELSLQRWVLNTEHKAQSGSCSSNTDTSTASELWSCAPGQHRYLIYPAHTTVIKQDLQSKTPLSMQQVQVTSVDTYGNVLIQTNSTEDAYGLASKTLTQSFDASEAWPNKLLTRKVTTDAMQNRHGSDPYSVAGQILDSSSWVQTSYSNFHSSRQPELMEMSASDNSPVKTIETSYNSYGLPLSVTESTAMMDLSGLWQELSSRSTTMEYGDTVARPAGAFVFRLTNAKGHVTTIRTLPEFGLRNKVVDANLLLTSYSYDAFGRLIRHSEPQSGVRHVTLDEAEYDTNAPSLAVTVQVIQQKGMPEQRVYLDMLGREVRTSVQGFSGEWINRDKGYDALGRLSRESLPYAEGDSPSWTEYQAYDELNRPGEKTTHDSRLSIQYSYDGLKTDINAGGIQMSRSYNSLGQLMETVDGEGGSTRYSYNGQGLPVVMQDANGVSLYAAYNALGMKLRVDDPNQGITDYVYNGFGELEQETDASGVNKYHDYDELGRETALKAIKAGVVQEQFSYGYDSTQKGLPDSESSSSVVRSFGYDAYGRLTSNTLQVDGEVFKQNYQYHSSSGQLIGKSYPNGLTVEYDYNEQGHLEQVKNAASGYVYRHITAQDAFGHITNASLGNGVLESRSYDAGTGWVQTLKAISGSVTVHQLSYSQYDSFGNLQYYSNAATNVSESYGYDDLHRLTSSTTNGAGASVSMSYSYD
ncbi:YD repeat-containing protein, partial [Rheinheimera soli]|nr:YD repeat-containing protein [Rheinheimera soli]